MRWVRRLLFLLLLCGTQLQAQNSEATEALTRAMLNIMQDLDRDTTALNNLRERIDTVRPPLAEELESLQQTVADRRQELDRIQSARLQGQRELAALKARTEALEQELTYTRSLFSEYGRALDTRMNVARPPEIMQSLDLARKTLEGDEDLAPSVEALLSASLAWNQERIGGRIFTGSAVDEEGRVHPGTFATLGPTAYFAAEDSTGPVGMALLRFGSDQPTVYQQLPREIRDEIRALTEGGTGQVSVDASGGDALRIAEANLGLWKHLQQGGFTMFPLAAVGFSALFLALWKMLDLSRMRVEDNANVSQVIQALRYGQVDQAKASATSVSPPLRQLVEDLVVHHQASREHLEEIMHEHVLASLPRIERNLGALAVLGGVAPLLGLLGTVTGMIQTFQLVTLFGSGDAKLLSSGISEALVTTETGLAIAIPTLLIHAYLSRRARGMVGALEVKATTLVNDLKLRT